jgi:hypothetical protein
MQEYLEVHVGDVLFVVEGEIVLHTRLGLVDDESE